MEFTLITADKLKVALDAHDLKFLGISYDSLDYTDPAAKELLLALLEQGKEKTSFRPRGARLFIEVFPSENGGCIICYTRLRTGQQPPSTGGSHGPEAVVFTFTDIDTLLDAAVKTYASHGHRIFKSSLYLLDGSWRLVIYPLDYADRLSVSFLREFAPKTGEGAVLAAFIEEHGRALIEDNALAVLAQYFS